MAQVTLYQLLHHPAFKSFHITNKRRFRVTETPFGLFGRGDLAGFLILIKSARISEKSLRGFTRFGSLWISPKSHKSASLIQGGFRTDKTL